MYSCKRCGYETNTKCVLINHLKKKNMCESIKEDVDRTIQLNELITNRILNEITYNCEFCGKKFNHSSTKCSHKKICLKKNPILQNNILQNKVDELTKIVETLKLNNTINLNSFGCENINYIDNEFIKKCLQDMNIVSLIKKVYFDKEHPENHIVKLKNKNLNLLQYYENGRWIIGIKNKIIEDMIYLTGYRILKTFYQNNNSLHNDEINNWLNKINNEDTKLFKELKIDIYIIVLNNKI